MRVPQSVLNGKLHVGQTKLSLNAAILELNAAVDDALWVDHHIDVLGLHVEQPAGLDHF